MEESKDIWSLSSAQSKTNQELANELMEEIIKLVRETISESKTKKIKNQKKKTMKSTVVGDRLKMIDEAGDKAALQAKISKIDEDIKEAQEIKASIPTNINHFVSAEIISDLMDDINESISGLENKKKELEDQMKSLDSNKVDDKPSNNKTNEQ